ncbi:helix-turn-helix domain-containing protein [Phenylobacterium sp.]|uniref:helix-turn-helix domain-containing protein n=1 Tax=Phenylobacterium sp. TaxID=1871053 RepID=UPI002F94583B
MSQEFYTVEAAAGRLGLHPKTVLRFIRDGRLKAARIGKSYRIQRSELDRLAGAPTRPAAAARVTSIVDVEGVDAALAQRLTSHLTAVRGGAAPGREALNVDVAHDPEHGRLKIIVVAGPADAAAMLRLVQGLLEP